jgi:hypothetical protein
MIDIGPSNIVDDTQRVCNRSQPGGAGAVDIDVFSRANFLGILSLLDQGHVIPGSLMLG